MDSQPQPRRDVICGLTFAALGALALVLAGAHRFGTLARIGPGFFPSLLGGLLVALGLVIAARGALAGLRAGWGEKVDWVPLALLAGLLIGAAILGGLGIEPRQALFQAAIAAMGVAYAAGRRVLALILGPIALFAMALESAGLVVASLGLLGVSALAARDFRRSEIGPLAILVTAFAWGLFAWGLGLPIPVWPKLG